MCAVAHMQSISTTSIASNDSAWGIHTANSIWLISLVPARLFFQALQQADPDVIVTSNIGCQLHLESACTKRW
jgi:hypothetical protein